jgi:integrase
MSSVPEPVSKKRKKISILNDLEAFNRKKKIKIRARKLINGIHSLYFHIRTEGKQEYQFLKLYILGKRDTRKIDEETLKLALEFRDKKELELFQNRNNFQLNNKNLDADFIQYFESLVFKKSIPDKSWKHTLKHLRIFTNGKFVPFRAVDEKYCEEFRDYLKENLSPNTGHTYYAKLKDSLNIAIKDQIILKNPAQFFHISKVDSGREFLILDELKKLNNTPCYSEQTKRAFLFSCFSGLRISDLQKLTFDDIQNGYLLFRQKKTRGLERLKLSSSALGLIEQQKADGHKAGKVFNLLTDKHTLNHLKWWARDAEINKNITWHVGRHTFATLAFTYGNDIYTVSKLLGHREVRTTQIYAKLIDKKKDDAMDRLPKI